jgi:hypothetical protein
MVIADQMRLYRMPKPFSEQKKPLKNQRLLTVTSNHQPRLKGISTSFNTSITLKVA